jgi:hypothetical protein
MYWSNEYHYRHSAADGTFEQPVPADESGVILVRAPNASYVSQVTSSGELLDGKAGPWWSVVGPNGQVVRKGVVFTTTPLHSHSHPYYGGEEWGRPIKDGTFSVGACDPSAPTDLYSFDPEHQWGATVRRRNPWRVRTASWRLRLRRPGDSVFARLIRNRRRWRFRRTFSSAAMRERSTPADTRRSRRTRTVSSCSPR